MDVKEETTVIKIKDGDPLVVSTHRLTANSSVFRHLIYDLKYDELEMDDFSPEGVSLFFALLEDKQLGEIINGMFRELHKLSVVFEVDWLREDSRSWLRDRINAAVEDQEKTFVFEECWFIFKKWGEKCMMNDLMSCLALEDNSSFISSYMSDLERLETGQVDLIITLGGSNTDLFLRIIQQNLSGQKELSKNIKYLLEQMNLDFCLERSEALFHEVFETISDLSEVSVDDMRFALKMISNTTRSVNSRRDIPKTKTSVLYDDKKNLGLINSTRTLDDIARAVSENHVTSTFVVIELLLRVFYKDTPDEKDTQIFLTTLEKMCSEKKLQKVSVQFLDANIEALNHSRLEQSEKLLDLLNEIRNNCQLATYNENFIIRRGETVIISKDVDYKHLYVFKHPATGTCTEDGQCGFIIRSRKQDDNWTGSLCTDKEDYTDTGIHLHDIISAQDIYPYVVRSGISAAGNKVYREGSWRWEKKWLPNTTSWKYEDECVAYNLANYRVSKA